MPQARKSAARGAVGSPGPASLSGPARGSDPAWHPGQIRRADPAETGRARRERSEEAGVWGFGQGSCWRSQRWASPSGPGAIQVALSKSVPATRIAPRARGNSLPIGPGQRNQRRSTRQPLHEPAGQRALTGGRCCPEKLQQPSAIFHVRILYTFATCYVRTCALIRGRCSPDKLQRRLQSASIS